MALPKTQNELTPIQKMAAEGDKLTEEYQKKVLALTQEYIEQMNEIRDKYIALEEE